MTFTLPPLPFGKNDLEPYISAQTLDFHYGKHHQAYVTNLNNLAAGTDYETKSLEEVILSSFQKMWAFLTTPPKFGIIHSIGIASRKMAAESPHQNYFL